MAAGMALGLLLIGCQSEKNSSADLPEDSKGDALIDCASWKAISNKYDEADESSTSAFKKVRPILAQRQRQNLSTKHEDMMEASKKYQWWWNRNKSTDELAKRKERAGYVVTAHLGYTKEERSRMWSYRSAGAFSEGGPAYLAYFKLPDDEKPGDTFWLINQGIPDKEINSFCTTLLGANSR